jgi:hypothetical protein
MVRRQGWTLSTTADLISPHPDTTMELWKRWRPWKAGAPDLFDAHPRGHCVPLQVPLWRLLWGVEGVCQRRTQAQIRSSHPQGGPSNRRDSALATLGVATDRLQIGFRWAVCVRPPTFAGFFCPSFPLMPLIELQRRMSMPLLTAAQNGALERHSAPPMWSSSFAD